MEEEENSIFGLGTVKVVIIAVMFIAIIVIASIIALSSMADIQAETGSATQNNETFISVYESNNSLIHTNITSLSATRKNDTWLEFDGVDDNVESERYNTISFWYKNATTDWTFIVNSSGTLYVNGSLGTPGIYPIYDNGINMYLGKLNSSFFFNGSMDDFRGYNNSIDAELVNLTYLGGRL